MNIREEPPRAPLAWDFRRVISVRGFGSDLVPRVPFRIRVEPARLAVEHQGQGIVVEGGTRDEGVRWGPIGNATVETVLAEPPGVRPHFPFWALHTGDYSFPLPFRLTVVSTPASAAWPFEIRPLAAGADPDEMIHVRGPMESLPDLGVQPGMRSRARGSRSLARLDFEWVEYEYDRGGIAWRQRLYALKVRSSVSRWQTTNLVLTAQARHERADALFVHSDGIVKHMIGA